MIANRPWMFSMDLEGQSTFFWNFYQRHTNMSAAVIHKPFKIIQRCLMKSRYESNGPAFMANNLNSLFHYRLCESYLHSWKLLMFDHFFRAFSFQRFIRSLSPPWGMSPLEHPSLTYVLTGINPESQPRWSCLDRQPRLCVHHPTQRLFLS